MHLHDQDLQICTREALHTLGKVFINILLPYVCVEMSLSEQLACLSTVAHMLLVMTHEDKAGTKLMPSQLYIDLMIMIKNAYFCMVKAKVDNPTEKFFLILLGTDRLEDIFGILRTMVGNDSTLDILQLHNPAPQGYHRSFCYSCKPS